MTTLINEIKEAYEFGNTYFTGEINGEEFKIRMNKNHTSNSMRNNDLSIHNLSLVNVAVNEAGIGCNTRSGKVQMQVESVFDWSDVEIHLEEFFYQIENI